MSSLDIAEAMAYERVEPFQRQRIDYWFKYLLAVTCNINRGKTAKALNLSDFDAPWERKPRKKPKTLAEQVREVFKIGGNDGK